MNRKPLLLLLFWIILAGYSSAQTPATINSIYYLIERVQPYLSHTTFDISSSVPEGQLFTQGNIICSYDTTIYGSYIVRSGEFTAHLSTDLDSSVYVLHVSDWGPDKIKISIISTGTTAIYDSLSPVPSALLSCQLNGSPANIGVGSAAFAFDGASMQQGSKYFNINTNLQQVFDSVYAISSFAPASETGIVHYSLVNFATDTIHQQIEFDISADDGAAGAFAAGIVFIDFNPAAFVSDLAAHSTITAPALYSGFVDNYGEHTLKVEVKTNGFAFITLPTRLAHIVLPYSTLLPTTLLSADSDLTASFPDLYYDSTAMSIMQYRGATASGRLRSGSIAAQIANTAYTSSLLTFDIQVQSNSGQYFHDATIDVTYDPSNFGSNVVANGNLSCTVSSSFNSTDYSFSSPTDVSANKFQIAVDGIYSVQSDYIAHNGSIPSLPYSTIASYTTIAACSLAVHNCCHSAAAGDYLSISSVSADYSTVSINQNGDPSDMNDDWYLDQNDNNSYTNGVFTGYDNSGTSLCTASTPTITSIDPLTITAGTFSVLTITGTGFGCATGVVYFTSDEPDISTMMHTQAIDIQSWTDNEIKVWVPSIQDNATGMSAASGPVVVEQAIPYGGNASPASGDDLFIPFSSQNIRYTSTQMPEYIGLINQTTTPGGYSFTPDAITVSTITNPIPAITEAMNDWKCQIGVNFTMLTAANVPLAPYPGDGINSISYQSLAAQGASAITYVTVKPSNYCTNSNGELVNSIIDIDMVIDNSQTFDITANTTTTMAGEYSLLGTTRHEWGHACGLNEVLNFNDLMYYKSHGLGTAPLTIQNDDQNGGLYVLVEVGQNHFAPCFNPNLQNFPPGCPTLVIVNGINNISNNLFSISVYPNPFNSNFTVQGDIMENAHMKVNIFDVLGQVIGAYDYGMRFGQIKESINTSSLSSGIYLIQVSINNSTSQVKLIKD